jgi:anthranilate synthase component II
MILIIDNYDSFTYNLVQQIGSLDYDVIVHTNDSISVDEISQMKPAGIIISPGPGNPSEAGISNVVIEHFYTSTPLLGVCLGLQCIGTVFGATLTHAHKIMHGKTSSIHHTDDILFKNIPNTFTVARYHSLALADVKSPLIVTATADDGEIMALRHRDYPVFGVQFHPESFLSEYGSKIMENFLTCTQR